MSNNIGSTVSEARQKAIATTRARHGEDFFARNGRKGGTALVGKKGTEYMRQNGSKGGNALVAKYGTHWMSTIGYAGALKTAELYYNSSFAEMMAHLRSLSNHNDAVWDDKLKCWKRVANGAEAYKAAVDAIANYYPALNIN